jgi:alkylhydroperoxidase family enzyme
MASNIAPLDLRDLPANLQDRLRPRVERLGYLGDFFRYCGHQPEALLHFYDFTESLKGALPSDVTETVALTIASRTHNSYEQVQHERLSRKLGFDEDWIAALVTPEADATRLSEVQRSARELALAMLAGCWDEAASWLSRLTDQVGEQQAVGVLMVSARYLAHSAISNTLHLGLPPPVTTGAQPHPAAEAVAVSGNSAGGETQ